MTDEVKEYFNQRYKESEVKVVPGHWPKFKTKEQVDLWFSLLNSMVEEAIKDAFKKNSRVCIRCDNEEVELDHNFCKICGLKLQEHATL